MKDRYEIIVESGEKEDEYSIVFQGVARLRDLALRDIMEHLRGEEQGPVQTRVNQDASQSALKGNEYAYKTGEEYEEIVGYKVNEAFKIGWSMARMKNKHFGIH